MRRSMVWLWLSGLIGGLMMFVPTTGQTPVARATVPNNQNWIFTPGTCDPAFQGAVFANWNPATGAPNCGVFTSGAPSVNQFDTGQVFPPNVLRDEASVTAPCENGRISGLCYRMWYVGTRPDEPYRRIGYAVSPDGVSWYRVQGTHTGGSVFEGSGTSGHSFDQNGVTTFHVIKDGGQYHMWYTGVSSDWRWVGFGYATSTNGITWVRQNGGAPVLTSRPGSGLFDDDRIIGPFVLIDEASAIAPCEGGRTSGRCFRMWYEGFRANNTFYVGHALSSDGISWSIVNGLAPLGSVLAGDPNGPLGFAAFDSNNVGLTAVIKDGAIYRMWYQAKSYQNPPEHPFGDWFTIGHVTSVDGVNWVRPNPNLLAFSGDMDTISVNPPGTNDDVWVVRLLKEDLTYRMWYATAGTPNSTRFGLAEMTQGSPITPTVLRNGDEFTITMTTQQTIPPDGSVLITLPPDVALDQFAAVELQGFEPGASLLRERAAVTDAYSGFAARDAILIRLPNGAVLGPKTIRFNLGAGAPNPSTFLIQTFDTHKVLERARVVPGDLRVTQSVASVVAGEPAVYTVTVSNVGPNAVTGAVLNSTFPAQLSGATWTCVPSGGASCAPTSGSGNWINKTLNLPVGSSVTFTVTGDLASTATGNLVSTVGVATPDGINELTPTDNTSTLSTPISVRGDLAITRMSNPAVPQAGQPITYTLTVTNAGPSTVVGATVVNIFPISVTNVIWNCGATSGSACPSSGSGSINAPVTLAPGGNAVFTATGVVSPAALTMPPHSAIVTVPGNVTDPDPDNNVFTDGGGLGRPADLTISKTVAPAVVVPGLPVTYTITVTNTGSADADGATVLDLFPPTISGVAWTCSGANGATCAQSSGSDNLTLSLPSFPVGGAATITITGVVAADATGNLVNTAQVLPPVGVDDPTFANNTSTLSTPISVRGDLAITRMSNPAVPQAGQPITYTLTVTNAGPSTVVGATVVNIFPISVTNVIWNCGATSGSACPSSGSGSINAPVTLAPGGNAVFTATGVVSPAALTMPPHSAIVTVPGNVTDPDPDNNVFTDGGGLGRPADLTISKTVAPAVVVPGLPVTYTITVTNTGSADADGATVLDLFPPTISGVAWTCSGANGATCAQSSGSGNLTLSLPSFPVGGAATITITGVVAADATGDLVNTAQVLPPVGVDDPTFTNNSATISSTLQPRTDLVVTQSLPPNAFVGQTIVYTVTVQNNGPSVAANARVSNTPPALVTVTGWACAASSGSSCGAASGSAPVDDMVTLAPGGTVIYTVTGVVFRRAVGALPFSSTVAAPTGTEDPMPLNNQVEGSTQALYVVNLPVVVR
jgi:uncharacterized repeat protein (TIGR01451 family)